MNISTDLGLEFFISFLHKEVTTIFTTGKTVLWRKLYDPYTITTSKNVNL